LNFIAHINTKISNQKRARCELRAREFEALVRSRLSYLMNLTLKAYRMRNSNWMRWDPKEIITPLQWLLLIWFFFHFIAWCIYRFTCRCIYILLYWLHFKKLFYIWCIKNICYLKIKYFDWYETFINSTKITSKILLFRDKIIIYLDLTSYFFNLCKANLTINIDR